MKRIALLVTALLLLPLRAGAGTAAPAAKEYTIRLDRPATVGETCTFDGTSYQTEDKVYTLGGETISTGRDEHKLHLKGTVRVLAVSAAHHAPTAMQVTTEECKYNEGNIELEPCKPGGTIMLTAEGKGTRVTINGTPATEKVTKYILSIFGGSDDDENAGPEIFGPKKKVKVAEEWDIDVEKLAKLTQEKEKGLVLDNPQTQKSGKGKLVSIEVADGIEYQNIHTEIDISDFQLLPLPPGMKVDQSVMHFTGTDLIPFRPDILNHLHEFKMTFLMHTKGYLAKNGIKKECGYLYSMEKGCRVFYEQVGDKKAEKRAAKSSR